MRKGPILADVEIPLKRLDREIVPPDPLQQQVVIMNALRSTDNLPVPFGRQHIHSQSEARILRIRLHVEGLDRRRVTGNDDRPVERLGEHGLLITTKVIAEIDGRSLFLEYLDGFAIRNARERTLHVLEF